MQRRSSSASRIASDQSIMNKHLTVDVTHGSETASPVRRSLRLLQKEERARSDTESLDGDYNDRIRELQSPAKTVRRRKSSSEARTPTSTKNDNLTENLTPRRRNQRKTLFIEGMEAIMEENVKGCTTENIEKDKVKGEKTVEKSANDILHQSLSYDSTSITDTMKKKKAVVSSKNEIPIEVDHKELTKEGFTLFVSDNHVDIKNRDCIPPKEISSFNVGVVTENNNGQDTDIQEIQPINHDSDFYKVEHGGQEMVDHSVDDTCNVVANTKSDNSISGKLQLFDDPKRDLAEEKYLQHIELKEDNEKLNTQKNFVGNAAEQNKEDIVEMDQTSEIGYKNDDNIDDQENNKVDLRVDVHNKNVINNENSELVDTHVATRINNHDNVTTGLGNEISFDHTEFKDDFLLDRSKVVDKCRTKEKDGNEKCGITGSVDTSDNDVNQCEATISVFKEISNIKFDNAEAKGNKNIEKSTKDVIQTADGFQLKKVNDCCVATDNKPEEKENINGSCDTAISEYSEADEKLSNMYAVYENKNDTVINIIKNIKKEDDLTIITDKENGENIADVVAKSKRSRISLEEGKFKAPDSEEEKCSVSLISCDKDDNNEIVRLIPHTLSKDNVEYYNINEMEIIILEEQVENNKLGIRNDNMSEDKSDNLGCDCNEGASADMKEEIVEGNVEGLDNTSENTTVVIEEPTESVKDNANIDDDDIHVIENEIQNEVNEEKSGRSNMSNNNCKNADRKQRADEKGTSEIVDKVDEGSDIMTIEKQTLNDSDYEKSKNETTLYRGYNKQQVGESKSNTANEPSKLINEELYVEQITNNGERDDNENIHEEIGESDIEKNKDIVTVIEAMDEEEDVDGDDAASNEIVDDVQIIVDEDSDTKAIVETKDDVDDKQVENTDRVKDRIINTEDECSSENEDIDIMLKEFKDTPNRRTTSITEEEKTTIDDSNRIQVASGNVVNKGSDDLAVNYDKNSDEPHEKEVKNYIIEKSRLKTFRPNLNFGSWKYNKLKNMMSLGILRPNGVFPINNQSSWHAKDISERKDLSDKIRKETTITKKKVFVKSSKMVGNSLINATTANHDEIKKLMTHSKLKPHNQNEKAENSAELVQKRSLGRKRSMSENEKLLFTDKKPKLMHPVTQHQVGIFKSKNVYSFNLPHIRRITTIKKEKCESCNNSLKNTFRNKKTNTAIQRLPDDVMMQDVNTKEPSIQGTRKKQFSKTKRAKVEMENNENIIKTGYIPLSEMAGTRYGVASMDKFSVNKTSATYKHDMLYGSRVNRVPVDRLLKQKKKMQLVGSKLM